MFEFQNVHLEHWFDIHIYFWENLKLLTLYRLIKLRFVVLYKICFLPRLDIVGEIFSLLLSLLLLILCGIGFLLLLSLLDTFPFHSQRTENRTACQCGDEIECGS